MPTAIVLARVSAANAFCTAICDPEYEASTSFLKPDIVQAFQFKFQSLIASFQESSDPVKSRNKFDLQRFESEFDSLCSDLNVPIAALRLLCSIYAHIDSFQQVSLPKELQDAFQKALLTLPSSNS
jgi:hypothetical protein